MSKKNYLHIGCATDPNFVYYTCVMLFSLFKNNLNSSFHIHLISKASNSNYLKSVSKLVKHYKHKLMVYELNDNQLQGFKVSGHASLANYYRLFYAQYVGNLVSKILYLDSDLLVLTDIAALYNIPMQDNEIISAVDTKGFDSVLHFGLNLPNGYFNSGVLLIDMNKWTAFGVTAKAINFINQNPDKIKFWDQDALNIVLANNWKKIDKNWNALVLDYSTTTKLIPKEIKILHYAGQHKPGSVHYTGPFKKIFDRYKLDYYLKHDWFGLLTEDKLWKVISNFFKKISVHSS